MIGFALINYLCITCVVFSVLPLHLHLLNNFCLDSQVFFLLLVLGDGGLEVREWLCVLSCVHRETLNSCPVNLEMVLNPANILLCQKHYRYNYNTDNFQIYQWTYR